MDQAKHLFFVKSVGARDAFCARVWSDVVPSLRAAARGALKICLTESANPKLTVLPLRRENLCMVSVWGEADRDAVLAALRSLGDSPFAYRVEESYPVRYERTWSAGTRSPGSVLLTMLAKNARLDQAAFMHEWHGRHTPKAMRIHPMWSYARNVVAEAVTPDAPAFEGVVEEHYRSLADIVNPVRMFGGPFRFLPHMVEVGLHANHFLDLAKTENYLVGEWHIVCEP